MKLKRAPWTFIVVAALFALLALLAVLQHRWLGEVSQGERERMQTNLRVAASHFAEDLDRELTRAYLAFQMDTALEREQTRQHYAECFARWTSAAVHPRLVRSLFLAEAADGRRPELARLDAETGVFERNDWPAELDGVRRSLDRQPAPGIPGQHQIIHLSLPPIDEEIPALVVPLVTLPGVLGAPRVRDAAGSGSSVIATRETQSLSLSFSVGDTRREISLPAPFGYAIVALDLDYINQELLPELAGRYFSSAGGLDYNLAIVSRRNPEKIIYKSDSSMSLASPDATADLFALRLDKIGSLVADSLLAGRGGSGVHSSRLAYRIFNLQQGEKPPGNLLTGEADGRWQLILKHRAGSLEAVVAASRRSNLIVSFGILLLLAVSLTLIMLSTRRAQRLARQQMEFVAGVSHELRTPLAVICSAGENLADGVIDDREQIKRYGAVIRNEGRRLTEMVEQVLEFAGIQSGRKAYNMTPVDVAGVIDNALSALEPALFAAEGFEVEKQIASYLPPVMADSSALSRAVQNLIDNAMKYSGESRSIDISARTEVREGKFEVQIAISDKGMGIAPAELAHIFEPFHRGSASVASQIHGNGLGLSLVKHIVEAHGGRIEVRSVEGEGSSFIINLPAAAETEEASLGRREVIRDA